METVYLTDSYVQLSSRFNCSRNSQRAVLGKRRYFSTSIAELNAFKCSHNAHSSPPALALKTLSYREI